MRGKSIARQRKKSRRLQSSALKQEPLSSGLPVFEISSGEYAYVVDAIKLMMEHIDFLSVPNTDVLESLLTHGRSMVHVQSAIDLSGVVTLTATTLDLKCVTAKGLLKSLPS